MDLTIMDNYTNKLESYPSPLSGFIEKTDAASGNNNTPTHTTKSINDTIIIKKKL